MTHQEMMDQLQEWENMGQEITRGETKEIELLGKKIEVHVLSGIPYYPVAEFQRLVASGMSEEKAFKQVADIVIDEI